MESAQNNSNGFTLLELLIVISLLTLLTGALVPNFSSYIANQNVRLAQEQLKNDLRTIQIRALTGARATSTSRYWGVKINPVNATRYYYFLSDTNSQAACQSAGTTDPSSKLPGDVVITNSTNGHWCYFFAFSDGSVTMNKDGTTTLGSISLGRAGQSNNCGRVVLNPAGQIKKTVLNQTCSN